jgi:hypothetical protein
MLTKPFGMKQQALPVSQVWKGNPKASRRTFPGTRRMRLSMRSTKQLAVAMVGSIECG